MKNLFYNADRHFPEFLSGSTMSAVQNFLKIAISQHDFQIFLEPKTTRGHALVFVQMYKQHGPLPL